MYMPRSLADIILDIMTSYLIAGQTKLRNDKPLCDADENIANYLTKPPNSQLWVET